MLHRVARADVVAFLDIDVELLAPRYRAAEQAMALLVRARPARRPAGRRGRLLVQTFLPRHEVVQAALLADPGRLAEPERARRRMLGLPPFAALAAVSAARGSDESSPTRCGPPSGVAVGGGDGSYTARRRAGTTSAAPCIAAPRPKGSRLRIAVDPPRA